MKQFKTAIFTLFTAVVLLSCSDEEKGPKYEFKDQNLQGKIDGQAYNYGEGTVDFSTEGKMSFDLFSDQETTAACDQFGFGDFVVAFFTMKKNEGLVELVLDFNGGTSQTVTLLNPDNFINYVTTEGAIEITSIADSVVVGKIDARMDENNYINGNFTATVCP
ncbi:hypothetical protein [Marinoscillum sp. MHG1-6]|uniref:hypothetical protein n=1 Tax=Marinoscillum sp. MHG1-6 TaxID=2959627 RepID=UPI002157A9A3|nr:hypothetical protein [Marinoscillum sp. MHG1-6]